MTSPNVVDILSLFRTVAPKAFFDELCGRLGIAFGSGIYNLAVVSWLMIRQRLEAHKSLSAVVQSLCQGCAAGVLSECKRALAGSISPQSWWILPGSAGSA